MFNAQLESLRSERRDRMPESASGNAFFGTTALSEKPRT